MYKIIKPFLKGVGLMCIQNLTIWSVNSLINVLLKNKFKNLKVERL